MFTATEAASVAVLVGMLLAFVFYRAIRLRQLPGILADSVVAFSLPMFAVASAGIMGWLISYLGIAQEVANFILSVTQSRVGIMLLVMFFMVVIGTVLSPVTAVIIFLPIIQGICIAAGINQVHMALVVVLSLTLGLITPPYGICLLIASQIGEVSMPRAFIAVLPLIALIMSVILAMILLPSVFLFLPQMMFPKAF